LPWRSTSIDPPSSEIRRLHINDHRSKTRRGARQGTEVEDMHPPGITNDSWTHNCSLTFPYPIEYKGAGVHSSKRFKEHGVHIAAIGKTHQTTLETSSSTKQSFFFESPRDWWFSHPCGGRSTPQLAWPSLLSAGRAPSGSPGRPPPSGSG
jgi:hypothetical protein